MNKKFLLFLLVVLFLGAFCISFWEEQQKKQNKEETQASESENFNMLSENQEKAVVSYAYETLDRYFENEEPGPAPEEFEDVFSEYDRVYISFFNQGKIRCCMSGAADKALPNRLALDIADAVERCAEDERFDGKLGKEETAELDMTVDFLFGEKYLPGRDMESLKEDIVLGIDAIEIEKEGKKAYFKSSVPIEKNYSLQTTLERLCVKAKLDSNCYQKEETQISKFKTFAFRATRGGTISNLYRNNVLIEPEDMTQEKIKESIELGYRWMKNDVNPETGMLEYLYYPSKDQYSSDLNHVRRLAATWSLSEMVVFLEDDSMKETVKATLDYYFANYQKENESGVYFSTPQGAKICYNAFVIMALLNTPDYPQAQEKIRELADSLLAQQKGTGRFLTDFEKGGESGIDYYVGESFLALAKLYEKTGEERYAQAIIKGFPQYRDYWRGNKNTAFIPWQSQAYLIIYRHKKIKDMADFVFEMNEWLIDGEQQIESKYPDYVGGFKTTPSNSTAAYAEGVCDAFELARLAGDAKRTEKFQNSCKLALRFVMQTQYTPDNIFYLENPEKALGGFRQSLLNNSQRCDSTQHAALALIKGYQYQVTK